jgi:hypothetical protein
MAASPDIQMCLNVYRLLIDPNRMLNLFDVLMRPTDGPHTGSAVRTFTMTGSRYHVTLPQDGGPMPIFICVGHSSISWG